jgi:hypothetical protein
VECQSRDCALVAGGDDTCSIGSTTALHDRRLNAACQPSTAQ